MGERNRQFEQRIRQRTFEIDLVLMEGMGVEELLDASRKGGERVEVGVL